MSEAYTKPEGILSLQTIAMPADTNWSGDVFGGWIVSQMDLGIAEQEKVESFGQVIENAWLGRVLLTQVRQQPLIELIDGVQVTALTQDTEQVHIEAKRGDEVLKLESKLLIAADGRDSFCRQAIGVGVDVHDYDQVAIVTTVQTSKPHEHVGFERFSALGPLALLP